MIKGSWAGTEGVVNWTKLRLLIIFTQHYGQRHVMKNANLKIPISQNAS